MALQTIGKVCLANQGGFVCKIEFQYLDDHGNRVVAPKEGGSILLGQKDTADPGDFGVPNGATFWLYVDVVWGDNNLASQAFIYVKGDPHVANYVISGTTLNNHLALEGVAVSV